MCLDSSAFLTTEAAAAKRGKDSAVWVWRVGEGNHVGHPDGSEQSNHTSPGDDRCEIRESRWLDEANVCCERDPHSGEARNFQLRGQRRGRFFAPCRM